MIPQDIKEILHNLDVRADILDKEALSQTLTVLINLVESLSEQNEKLKIETQKLKVIFNNDISSLKYKLTPKYPLLHNDSINSAELLISTSKDEIIKSALEYDGVISFEGRDKPNNIFHINDLHPYQLILLQQLQCFS